MPKSTDISAAEWEVMNVLWSAAGPMTAGDVIAALAGRRDWSPRTVKTLLNRLVGKGALGFDADGKRYLYRPRVSREACVRTEGRSFLSRVFGGAIGPMLIHFAAEAELSPEEVAALQRILAGKRKAPAESDAKAKTGGKHRPNQQEK